MKVLAGILILLGVFIEIEGNLYSENPNNNLSKNLSSSLIRTINLLKSRSINDDLYSLKKYTGVASLIFAIGSVIALLLGVNAVFKFLLIPLVFFFYAWDSFRWYLTHSEQAKGIVLALLISLIGLWVMYWSFSSSKAIPADMSLLYFMLIISGVILVASILFYVFGWLFYMPPVVVSFIFLWVAIQTAKMLPIWITRRTLRYFAWATLILDVIFGYFVF